MAVWRPWMTKDDIAPPEFDANEEVKSTPEKKIKQWAETYHKNGGDVVMTYLNAMTGIEENEHIKWGDVNEDDPQERTVFGCVVAMLCPHVTFEKVFEDIGDLHVKFLGKMMKKHGVGPGGLLQKDHTRGPCDDIAPPEFDANEEVKSTPEKKIKQWAETYHKNGGDVVMTYLNAMTGIEENEHIKWGDVNEDDPQERTVFGCVVAMLCPHVAFEKVFEDIGDLHVKFLGKMMKKHGVGPGGLLQKTVHQHHDVGEGDP